LAAHRNGNGYNGTNGQVKHVAPEGGVLAHLRAQVKLLCEQVGFGLAKSVMESIAATEKTDEITDTGMLVAVASKLEDTLRGVERLKATTDVVGQARFSDLCRELNLPGDCLDDIPHRRVLRRLIDILEAERGATPIPLNGNGRSHAPAGGSGAKHAKELGTARATLIREAQRVARLRNMKLPDVVDRAAKGSFRFSGLSPWP
jgi:hypothetical protein